MLFFAHVGLALASARALGPVSLAFLALGSMLPDIIDKPLGLFIFGSMSMGRTFAHTLIFLLLLFAISLIVRDLRAFSLTWGVFIHLILDSMWRSPQILLWPFLGPFPDVDLLDTFGYFHMLMHGLERPQILIPEMLGLGYIIFLIHSRRSEVRARIEGYFN